MSILKSLKENEDKAFKEFQSKLVPNIDPEKGEGFEDDIFVAACFSRFPDKAFIFPKDIIS